MGKEFRFLYKYKRGDTCNYCGTVFGYDVESEIGASHDNVNVAFQVALAQAEKKAKEEALFRPCPRCGRLPSEAYARQFGFGSFFLSGCLPILLGFAAVMIAVWTRLCQTNREVVNTFVVAAFCSAVWFSYRSLCAHRVFFRAPAKNLEESKEKSEANLDDAAEDTEFRRERVLKESLTPGVSGRETTFPELPKILGTRPECATGREMKGRRLFWFLSAVRIAAPFTFAAPPLAIWGLERGWLGGDAGLLAMATIVFLALLILLGAYGGDDETRYQGERHFGCGWNRVGLRAELAEKLKGREGKARGNIETLRQVELKESARAVEVLRATTDLTPEGALFLRIAEEETKELEALREKEKEKKKNDESAKPAPSANVAAKKSTEEALKEATGKSAAPERVEAKKDDVATTREDAALDASAKRLSKYDR